MGLAGLPRDLRSESIRSTRSWLLGGLGGESKIALEATYGWGWLAELLEDHGYELHPASPLRTKAIAAARVKTDAVRARTLAHLLRADPALIAVARRVASEERWLDYP